MRPPPVAGGGGPYCGGGGPGRGGPYTPRCSKGNDAESNSGASPPALCEQTISTESNCPEVVYRVSVPVFFALEI